MFTPGAEISGFMRLSTGPQLGPAGPRLEKLLMA
jgi:hypothetical protein